MSVRAVGDVRRRMVVQAVAAAGGVRDVVHCAAVAGVRDAEDDPYGSATTNLQGALAVMETARLLRLRRIVDLSSEEVYGDPGRAVIHEDCQLAPTSFYGLHKATVERLAETWVRHDVDYVAARLAWVYGSGFPRDRLPAPWLRDAASNRTSTLKRGGDHEVDLVYINDAAGAVVALLHADRLHHRAYNVASGGPTRLRDLAAALHAVRPGWSCDLGPGSLPGMAVRPALAVERIRQDTGWSPCTPLGEGLATTVAELEQAGVSG